MISFRGKAVPIREKRLNTISAYLGDAASLLQEIRKQDDVKQRIRTFSETNEDDVIMALRLCSKLRNTGIVIHGPRGCAAANLYFENARQEANHWMVSNLDEKDTIMGGEESLREAVISLYKRHHPSLILVITTPVVAINNDDVLAVITELQEELAVNIVSIYVDGFKSRAQITGYDAVFYALLKQLPFERDAEKEKKINVLSIGESAADLAEIRRLLKALAVNYRILPQEAELQELLSASRAAASLALNRDESDFIGQVLQENYQVDFLTVPPPIGINGTYQWLLAVGKVLGISSAVEALHTAENEKLQNVVSNSILRGKKVYIGLPAAIAWRVVILVQELGGQVIGLTLDHLDQLHEAELAEQQPELQIHVGSGQIFEQTNLLRQVQPDLYLGSSTDTVWAAKQGVAAVDCAQIPLFGYQGVDNLSRQVQKIFANQAFIQCLRKSSNLSYKAAWYNKKANWHIKLEVK